MPQQTLLYLAIIVVTLGVFTFLSLQVVFRKLGESGWKAWVPVLNGWEFFNVSGMSGFWILATPVPVLGTVVTCMAVYKISQRLGFDGTGMVFLSFFFPTIWLFIVAASRNKSPEELLSIQQKRDRRVNPNINPSRDVVSPGRSWALAGIEDVQPPVIPVQNNPIVSEPEVSFGYSRRTTEQQSAPDYANPNRPHRPEQY